MDSQQVNSGPPEVSAPYSIPADMSPEAAGARAKELVGDQDFCRRLYAGGKDSRESRELDALQRRATGQEAVHETRPAAAQAPAIAEISAELTPEAAKIRLGELRSDPAWVAKFSRGDAAAQREFDRLTEIAAGTYDDKRLSENELRETRAAALDTVPETAKGYSIDWRAVSPRDPVPQEGQKALTGWAHEIGLTQSEMSTVVQLGAVDVERYGKLNAAQRETKALEVIKNFGRAHGDDALALYNGALDLAEELSAKDPMFRRFINETGILDSPAFLETLAIAALRRGSK